MPNNKKKDGLIMQAGILAVAGIIVRIIGLLYNTPLTNIIVFHQPYRRSSHRSSPKENIGMHTGFFSVH